MPLRCIRCAIKWRTHSSIEPNLIGAPTAHCSTLGEERPGTWIPPAADVTGIRWSIFFVDHPHSYIANHLMTSNCSHVMMLSNCRHVLSSEIKRKRTSSILKIVWFGSSPDSFSHSENFIVHIGDVRTNRKDPRPLKRFTQILSPIRL